jgi:hypothetical protein
MATVAAEEARLITESSVDPEFDEHFVEVDEWRPEPVPHRYVHGGFVRTQARFSFYFPPEEQYRRRFFHNTYPMAVTSDIGPFPIAFEVATGDLGFTLDSGAAYVQTNNGGTFRVAGVDPAIAAYRVNAAAAKVFKRVAAEIYGEHRPWGYLFGGSGGAYQTMGAAENTRGVWDGFVPFVLGCNHAIPSMFTVRMHALRVLRRRDRFPGIVDAVSPGGSGDPYAGLDQEEAAALREVTLMGFPPRGWYGHATMDSGYFANISGMIPLMDPSYAEDFWSKPGYLGTDPGSSIAGERRQSEATLASVAAGPPVRLTLDQPLDWNCADAHVVVLSGAAVGASLPIARGEGAQVTLIATADPAASQALSVGDRVRVDNSWALALQTYHRHQVPPEPEYYGWNQFRGPDGVPLYPQRPVLVGPTGTANAAGSVLAGRVHGKVLLLSCLMDIDAYPWQTDWYRGAIARELGEGFADEAAIWFIDHAHHENPMTPLARAHAVSYGGALQQALRDLARWVEEGVRPTDTNYRIEDSQVVVPKSARERGGIQPVVALAANGGDRAEVRSGEPVRFEASVEVPAGAGEVVSAEWDFEGAGEFSAAAGFTPSERLVLSAKHAYDKPGTYFPVLRAASQREGDPDTPYGRVQNIGRVRVVVD